LLSTTSQYAIRALGYIAVMDSENRIRSEVISRATGVPRRFLLKILNTLKSHGILTTSRGVGGGFSLARSADTIRLSEVVAIFEDFDRVRTGLLGDDFSTTSAFRAIDETLQAYHDRLSAFLHHTTIDVFSREDFPEVIWVNDLPSREL